MPKLRDNATFTKPDGTIDERKFMQAFYSVKFRERKMIALARMLNSKNDLYDMAWTVGHRDLYEPLHKWFCDKITDEQHKRRMILMPRKHFKTTLGTIDYCVYRIVRNPQIKILIVSATKYIAEGFLAGIATILEKNDNFGSVHGQFKGDKVWNKSEILVKQAEKYLTDNTYTVETSGVDQTVTGKHFDLIIFDDVVSKENVKNAEQRKKVKEVFDECSQGLLRADGEILVLGTRWHFADLYGQIMENDSTANGGDYDIHVRNCIEGFTNIDKPWDGKVIFPFNGDIDKYRKMEAKNEYMFWCNQMNYPKISKDKPLNPQWLQRYEVIDMKKVSDVKINIDPASGKNKWNDGTGVTVFGKYENKVIILALIKARLDTKQILDVAVEQVKKFYQYGCRELYIENAGNQAHLIEYVKKEFETKKSRGEIKEDVEIEELKPHNREKNDRIIQIKPYIKDGTFIFPKIYKYAIDGIEVDMMAKLIEEMDEFPLGEKDDLLDGLAYILDVYEMDTDFVDYTIDKAQENSYNGDKNEKGQLDENNNSNSIYDTDTGEVVYLED